MTNELSIFDLGVEPVEEKRLKRRRTLQPVKEQLLLKHLFNQRKK
ncbi:hypothetical protein [Cytobacillus firmus]